MLKPKHIGILIFLLVLSTFFLPLHAQENLDLWYTTPAAQWKEGLPIGNGRMGTMIKGDVATDELVINEETIWSGGIHDYLNPEAKAHLKEIRQLILDKKHKKALAVGDKHMLGKPKNLQMYQPLGNLVFDFGHSKNITDYKRSLSLNNAIVQVSYRTEGYSYTREYFASNPHDVLVMRFSTDNPKGIQFKLRHTSEHETKTDFQNNTFILRGKGQEGRGIQSDISFESRFKILGNDSLSQMDDGDLLVKGDKEVVLIYTAATNYKSFDDVSGNPSAICDEILASVNVKNYNELYTTHVKDYSGLFDRVSLNLGATDLPKTPTNELIERLQSGEKTPMLDVLFYQMSRYLIIAGSRKGTQPLNLQGIWNDNMTPPWDSKWTLNINLPMNYWMVEAGNLTECHEPVFDIVKDLSVTGGKVAKTHYGARGFVVHHNTDIWRAATPVDGAKWGLWTSGGAWLTRHLWEHYLYTQDESFLKEAYPIMKEASLFFFDFLSEGNQGYLVTSPSISFEQSFVLNEGGGGRLTEGPTMDNQMLRDLFENCYRAGKIVKDDEVYLDSLQLLSKRLKPTTIDKEQGDLMEWTQPAKPKPIRGQLAPLWAVNPGTEINYIETPKLAAAAEKTIRLRDPHIPYYETSGSWVSGTRANFWARLHKGNDAYNVIQKMMKENMFPNLLASFFPEKYFQIDGNLGTAAAYNEMLLQSHRFNDENENIQDILPALPSDWVTGEIKGLRSRGGFELDISWKDGALEKLRITSTTGNRCNLWYQGKKFSFDTEKGKTYKLDGELSLL